MKKNISKVQSFFKSHISQAKANCYEAIMLPLDCEYEPYSLNNIDDVEHICDIATDYGWDQFILIDLINNKTEFISLFELEAA
jgi:hypothetical protein